MNDWLEDGLYESALLSLIKLNKDILSYEFMSKIMIIDNKTDILTWSLRKMDYQNSDIIVRIRSKQCGIYTYMLTLSDIIFHIKNEKINFSKHKFDYYTRDGKYLMTDGFDMYLQDDDDKYIKHIRSQLREVLGYEK